MDRNPIGRPTSPGVDIAEARRAVWSSNSKLDAILAEAGDAGGGMSRADLLFATATGRSTHHGSGSHAGRKHRKFRKSMPGELQIPGAGSAGIPRAKLGSNGSKRSSGATDDGAVDTRGGARGSERRAGDSSALPPLALGPGPGAAARSSAGANGKAPRQAGEQAGEHGSYGGS